VQAFAEQQNIGLLTAGDLQPGHLMVGTVEVDEPYRRLGVATRMYELLFKEAKRLGFNTVLSSTFMKPAGRHLWKSFMKNDPSVSTEVRSSMGDRKRHRFRKTLESLAQAKAAQLLEQDNFRELLKDRRADQPVQVPKFLYHATTASRLPLIQKHGLEARAENPQDTFSNRVYLTTDEAAAVKIAFQLRKALIGHGRQKRNWVEDYVILKVDTARLSNEFKVDGYFPGSVYTDSPITPAALSVARTIPGQQLMQKNWPKFWDGYLYPANSDSATSTHRPSR
jgi:GNAT superfamily N-acetyltransferase